MKANSKEEKMYKSKISDGQEILYMSDWITELEKKEHFAYYWKQAFLVYQHSSRQDKILELGVGTYLLSDLLHRRGFSIKTLDIDEDKHADFTCDALSFEYNQESFDTLLAFEVFEHMPYDTFSKVIEKVTQSTISKILFSLPYSRRRIFSLDVKLPFVIKKSLNMFRHIGHISTPAHHWELSRKTRRDTGIKHFISEKSLMDNFENQGWKMHLVGKIDHINFYTADRV